MGRYAVATRPKHRATARRFGSGSGGMASLAEGWGFIEPVAAGAFQRIARPQDL